MFIISVCLQLYYIKYCYRKYGMIDTVMGIIKMHHALSCTYFYALRMHRSRGIPRLDKNVRWDLLFCWKTKKQCVVRDAFVCSHFHFALWAFAIDTLVIYNKAIDPTLQQVDHAVLAAASDCESHATILRCIARLGRPCREDSTCLGQFLVKHRNASAIGCWTWTSTSIIASTCDRYDVGPVARGERPASRSSSLALDRGGRTILSIEYFFQTPPLKMSTIVFSWSDARPLQIEKMNNTQFSIQRCALNFQTVCPKHVAQIRSNAAKHLLIHV